MAKDDYQNKYFDAQFSGIHRRLDDIEQLAKHGVEAKGEIVNLKSQIKLAWTIAAGVPVIAGVLALFGVYSNPIRAINHDISQ